VIDDVAIGMYVSQLPTVRSVDILPTYFSFDPHNMVLNPNHLGYMNNFNKSERYIDINHLIQQTAWYAKGASIPREPKPPKKRSVYKGMFIYQN
jgi:hypothetical protein